ncbi:response regulator [Vibrio sp. SA48]
MLLEDQMELQATLNDQLHQMGYITLVCNTGEEALRIMENNPEINILISDIALPGKTNGIEVVKRATTINTELKALLISGHHEAMLNKHLNLPAPLLKKPFNQEQLKQALHSL